ncbi:MFS transporter [Natrialbaceae archaeon A-chndr2]
MHHLRDLSTFIFVQFKKLNEGGRGFILVAISMGWFLSIGVRNIYPVLIPYLRDSFSMSLTVSGLLFALLWLAYALGQFPGGVLVDRIGGRNILVISTGVSLLTLFILISAFNIWMLFIATILFGLATALYGPARFTVLYDIYDHNDGLAIGITLAAGNIGNAVLPVIAGILAAYFVWQAGIVYVIPLFIITIYIMWVKIPKKTVHENKPSQKSRGTVTQLQRIVGAALQPRILIITLILLINTFIIQGFTAFYPTYLMDVKGISPTLATLLFGLFFTTGIIVQPISGVGNDNFSPSLTIAMFVGCIVVGLFFLPFFNSIYNIIAVTILLSALMGTPPTATSQLVHLLPDEIKGSGLGLLRTLYMLVASTGSIFIGFLADLNYFDEAFIALGIIALFALSLALTYYWIYEKI